MAITYNWDIQQMNAHISSSDKTDVIYNVQWTYTGLDVSGGVTYTEVEMGTQNYTYVSGSSFTPYANTEAFEAIVTGWLTGSLDVPAMQSTISSSLVIKMAPVDTNLYFTWDTSSSGPTE